MRAALRPRLEVRHLRALLAVEEAGSVAAAAGVLGVTPSALTHRLREAERRIGAPLYTRVRGRLRPTPAADTLRQAAERLVVELDRAEASARAIAGGVEDVVRLGMGFYTAFHWLPRFMAHLRRTAPGLDVELVAEASRRPFAQLAEGGIDVAIVASPPAGSDLEAIPLFTDELVAVMAPDHRLAGRASIVAEDLVDEDYLSYSRTVMVGHEHERLFNPAGVNPRRYVTVEFPEAIVELVAAGFGTSILARWAVAHHLRQGTLAGVRVTEEGLQVGWFAAVRADDGGQSAAHRLAAALAEWCGGRADAFAGS